MAVRVRPLFRLPSLLCLEWAMRLVSRLTRLAFMTLEDGSTYVAVRV